MTDEIHRAALAASIPPTIRWLDAEAVGAMLGYSARHLPQRLLNVAMSEACHGLGLA